MIKWCVIVFISLAIGWGIYCARPNNGIVQVNKEGVILTGELAMWNYNATLEQANQVMTKWRELRGI